MPTASYIPRLNLCSPLDSIVLNTDSEIWSSLLKENNFSNFVLKTMFGKANRQSKTYAALVHKYQDKREEGGRASGKFIPPPQTFEDRSKLISQFQNLVSKLKKQIDEYSEASLDELILPHPLLGKLTLREMLYFTAYHATHHQRLVEKYLSYKG